MKTRRQQSHPVVLQRQPQRRDAGVCRQHRAGRDRHPQAVCADRHVHLRSGLLSTASCQSAITYIDGDKGELLYRGFPIEQLATQADYLDTCFLLLNGELPNEKERGDFHKLVINHTMVNEQMQFFLRGFRRDAHPMAVLTGLVGALSAFYHDSTDINNPEHRRIAAIRLIAKMPTLVAMAYKYGVGQPFMYPKNDLSYSGNFLRMMFGTPGEEYKVNPVLEKALDRIFILHADHEQNASPRRSACAARRAPTRSPPSRPVWPACGVRPTAAPTKPA